MRKAVIAIILACLSVTARAQQNTVELDAAMETCRQHTVSETMPNGNRQFVFAPGWEDCNTIEQLWDIKQGGGTKSPDEAAKSAVHNSLMKILNGQK